MHCYFNPGKKRSSKFGFFPVSSISGIPNASCLHTLCYLGYFCLEAYFYQQIHIWTKEYFWVRYFHSFLLKKKLLKIEIGNITGTCWECLTCCMFSFELAMKEQFQANSFIKRCFSRLKK